MLSAVADSLFIYLKEAFPASRAYSRADLQRPPMPPIIAHFMAQALGRRYEIEIRNLRGVRSAWFNYSHPDVLKAEEQFTRTLGQQIQFPKEEWSRSLRQAVQRVTAYLVHPTQTLAEFVFHDAPERLPSHVVLRRVGYFDAYPYLHRAVESYFKQKSITDLDQSRFLSVLSSVDRHITKGYTPHQWIRLLQPLFTLTSLAPVASHIGIPIPLLRTFFGAKGAYDIQERLLFAEDDRAVDALDEADLRQLLEQAQMPAPTIPSMADALPPLPDPVTTVPKDPDPAPAFPDLTDVAAEAEADAAGDADTPVPLWKRYQQPSSFTTVDVTHEAQEAPPKPVINSNGAAEDAGSMPLWQRFRAKSSDDGSPAAAGSDEQADDELAALEQDVLGEARHERRRFIHALFSDSKAAYTDTLRQLQATPDWHQASDVIAREVFKKHKVNIYSGPAIAFTNAIEKRYAD